jgi:hypothetical protein
LKETSKGQVALSYSWKLPSTSHFFIFPGNLGVSGKITTTSLGAVLPQKMEADFIQKGTNKKVLSKTTFQVNVNSDGTIPPQKFRFDAENVVTPFQGTGIWSIIPVDRDLPDCMVRLKVTYGRIVPPGSADISSEDAEDTTPEVQKISFRIIESHKGGPKGSPVFDSTFKLLVGAGFALNGNLKVSGKVIPETGQLPSVVRIHYKFRNPHRVVTKTGDLDVNVPSDGKIPVQLFPFSAPADSGGPKSSIEFSFSPQDRDLPDSHIDVSISFIQSTTP